MFYLFLKMPCPWRKVGVNKVEGSILMAENSVHNRIYPIDLLLVVVFCIAFFGYRLGSYVPLSDHEGLVAVTAQETLEGNWIVPHYDGQIRLQKTPLMYWTVATLGMIFGELSEFVVRLPSALAATGIAIILTIFVGRMFGRFPGIITGLATASTTGILWQSHVGNADMMMTFFVTLCFLFLYVAINDIREGKPSFVPMMVAYVAFSLAMLAKGPVPVLTILPPLFVYLIYVGFMLPVGKPEPLCSQNAGCPIGAVLAGMWQYLRRMYLPLGVLIFAVLVGGWVAAILLKVPNAITRWNEEYVARCLGEFGTTRSFFYYFPQIFLMTLPWSVFLPLGLILPFRKELSEKRAGLLLVFLWLVIGFFFFSAAAGKRSHYILPIVPPAIMLSVVGMIYALEHWLDRKSILIGAILVILATGGGVTYGYTYIQNHYPEMVLHFRILAAILLFTEFLALVAYFRWNILVPVTAVALGIGISFAIIWPLVPRFEDISRNPRAAAERIRMAVGPDAAIYSIGKANGPLIYYYGRKMPQIPEDQEVVEIFNANDKDVAIALLQERIAERVIKLIKQHACVYFVTSDTRFMVAQGYANREKVPIYEILRIPQYFSDAKGLVVFSNCPKANIPPSDVTQPSQ